MTTDSIIPIWAIIQYADIGTTTIAINIKCTVSLKSLFYSTCKVKLKEMQFYGIFSSGTNHIHIFVINVILKDMILFSVFLLRQFFWTFFTSCIFDTKYDTHIFWLPSHIRPLRYGQNLSLWWSIIYMFVARLGYEYLCFCYTVKPRQLVSENFTK